MRRYTGRLGPLDPVIDAPKKKGSINVGNSPPPTSPTIDHHLVNGTSLNAAWGITIPDFASGYALVACEFGNRLTAIDISNPSAMSIVGSLNHAAFDLPVTVSARTLNPVYLGDSNGFHALDLSDPTTPAGWYITKFDFNDDASVDTITHSTMTSTTVLGTARVTDAVVALRYA